MGLRLDLTEQEARELLLALDARLLQSCRWLEERPQDPGASRSIGAILKIENAVKEAFLDLSR